MANLQNNANSEVENKPASSDVPAESPSQNTPAEALEPSATSATEKPGDAPSEQAATNLIEDDPTQGPEPSPEQANSKADVDDHIDRAAVNPNQADSKPVDDSQSPKSGTIDADSSDHSEPALSAAQPESNVSPKQAEPDDSLNQTESDVQANKPEPDDPPKQAGPALSAEQCQQQLAKVVEEIAGISHKNSKQLLAIRSVARSLGKNIRSLTGPPNQVLMEAFNDCQQQLDNKLEKNQAHQQSLLIKSKELISLVKQTLEAGKIQEALQHWDRLQGNISNTNGKLQTELHNLASEHKSKLTELRDWKTFAATEKKKELIAHIQHLLESRMHAGDKAKHIAALHKEWKALGKSHQNETLWKQFKKISDKAYEPCKEYFKKRKQLMADNLIQRKIICTQLEDYIAELSKLPEASDDTQAHAINISKLSKIEAKAKEEWKRYAPLEQTKVKAIQKRYHEALNQLRKFRKSTLKTNARLKQDLVSKAQQLVSLEDNQQAMREAQKLQKEWKQIGPGSYREDNQYWQVFRGACDEIFKARDDKRKQDQEIIRSAEAQLDHALQALLALGELEDDQLRNARGTYHDLQQQFSAALDPRIKKDRKRYLDKFNDCKRRIDHRLQSMPDKKQQQQKDNLQARANFCLQQEEILSNNDNEEQFQAARNALDKDSWQALATCADEELDRSMEQRFSRLAETPSLAAWQVLMQEQTEIMKTMCVELEIRSEAESPKTEQALRMKIQLDQLKAGFGQQKPSRKENLNKALRSAMQALCLGPIDSETRPAFDQRISRCLEKLR